MKNSFIGLACEYLSFLGVIIKQKILHFPNSTSKYAVIFTKVPNLCTTDSKMIHDSYFWYFTISRRMKSCLWLNSYWGDY